MEPALIILCKYIDTSASHVDDIFTGGRFLFFPVVQEAAVACHGIWRTMTAQGIVMALPSQKSRGISS